MFLIGISLFILGLLLAIVGGIWGLLQAFSESTLWGVAYLFIPWAFVIFYMTKWSHIKIRKNFIFIIVGLILSVLGSAVLENHIANNFVADSASIPDTSVENTAVTPVVYDPFREGINQGIKAAELAQTANTQAEWNQVALTWNQALILMKEVPESHPQYTTAQSRVDLYRNNREIAKQKAASSN